MAFERRWCERVGWGSVGAAAVHCMQGELAVTGAYLLLGVVALAVARW